MPYTVSWESVVYSPIYSILKLLIDLGAFHLKIVNRFGRIRPLFAISSMWALKLKFSSSVTPRSFVLSVLIFHQIILDLCLDFFVLFVRLVVIVFFSRSVLSSIWSTIFLNLIVFLPIYIELFCRFWQRSRILSHQRIVIHWHCCLVDLLVYHSHILKREEGWGPSPEVYPHLVGFGQILFRLYLLLFSCLW